MPSLTSLDVIASRAAHVAFMIKHGRRGIEEEGNG
jgi:hypothetical protein